MKENIKIDDSKRKNNSLNYIKVFIDILKDYLSIILIVPAIFGGLWQLFELISIQFSLIRFFSISQIVADGLLFIMFSPAILFFILPFITFDSVLFHNQKTKIELTGTKVDNYLFENILKFSILMIALYYFLDYISKDIEQKSNGYTVWMLLIGISMYALVSYLIKDQL